MSTTDRARARALLDTYGYADRDGDGWRELPDGRPLRLEMATQPDQLSRQLDELWKKSMSTIGVRIDFKAAKWPENLRHSRAGKLMMWRVGWSAAQPDGDTFLALGYGPNKGQANHARFDLPAYNALYARQRQLPDGAEREAAVPRGEEALRRVRAVQAARASHRNLDRPSVGGRLSPPSLHARLLEVRRHRHRPPVAGRMSSRVSR